MKRVPKVGDYVWFLVAGRPCVGIVIEDRGCIGVRGRRLVAVKGADGRYFEIPLSHIQGSPEQLKAGL